MRTNKTLLPILIIIVIILAGSAAYIYINRIRINFEFLPFITKNDQKSAGEQTQSQPLQDGKESIQEEQVLKDINIVNWKTYQSKEWGIEFKYPADGQVNVSDGSLIIKTAATFSCIDDARARKVAEYPCDEIGTNMYIGREQSKDVSLKDYVDKKFKNGDFSKNSLPQAIKLGDVDAFEAEGLGIAGAYENIYLKNNDYIFEAYTGKEMDKNGPEILKQIISTFKFIEPAKETVMASATNLANIANWAVYRSEEYGFEFKYPSFFSNREIKTDERISIDKKGIKEITLKELTYEEGGDLIISVYEGGLKNYQAIDVPGATIACVDENKKIWLYCDSKEPIPQTSKQFTKLAGDIEAYSFSTGDGLWSAKTLIIPQPSKNRIILLTQSVSAIEEGNDYRAPKYLPKLETIYSTFKLIETLSSYGNLFEQHKIAGQFSGRSAALDLNSSEAAKFKTILTNAYQSAPNFAGHYTFIYWGCGSPCQRAAVIDHNTGEVYFLAEPASAGFEVRGSSNLVIVNPTGETKKTCAAKKTAMCFTPVFYLFENNKFNKIEISQ